MPLFTKTILAGVAALLSIPIFGTAIIASSYPSPILNHLVDIINGTSTQTVVSLNAPNWSNGIPLAVPIAASAATTTGGSMASSTQIYFAVAALDGAGTTTISNSVNATTDASTTGLGAEAFNVSWGTVPGATGYAVYFGSLPTTLNAYVLASSTNGVPNTTVFIASTTSGQLTGSDNLTDSTAFAVKINPLATSYFNGGSLSIGTSTAASTTAVEISGLIRARTSATTTSCYAATAGDIFFNTSNSHAWGCNGTTWVIIF